MNINNNKKNIPRYTYYPNGTLASITFKLDTKYYVTIIYYPSHRIKNICFYNNKWKLDHYFKPARSVYRDDYNNTLFKEEYYSNGKISQNEEGLSTKYYYT
jgi:antitoxin component YwqK of YwqJK toxin-antitoxin module